MLPNVVPMVSPRAAVAAILSALASLPCYAQRAEQVSTGARVFADSVISDRNEQWRITFSPDGRTAWFAESEDFFPVTRKATIYFSTPQGDSSSEPQGPPFSGRYTDMDPFVSRDGRRLYFSSIRPIGDSMPADIDIWMVERTTNGWSDPIHLGPEVNSSEDELYPSESVDGTLYFASGPLRPAPGKHWDIFTARRSGNTYSPRTRLGKGVNTEPLPTDPHVQAAWEFNPEISPDGNTLYFTSLRPGGFGFGDIYVSRRVTGEWAPAENIGPAVNTAADEYHPTLSPDGAHLYFARRRPARGDFYRITITELMRQ